MTTTNPNQTYSPTYLAEDKSQNLINVVVAFAILDTLFICLFFTSRVIGHTANGLDMYLMIPAYLFAFANIILGALYVQHGGAGRHVAALDPTVIVRWQKLTFALNIIYTLSVCFPKLAILALYKRIFSTRAYRYITYAIGGIVILNCVAGPISSLIMCRPIAYNWDKSIPNGHCGDIVVSYRYYSVPNIFTDVCILVLPLYGVWHLHMNRIHKIGLTITFLLGCVGMLTGILRMVNFFGTDLFADITFECVVGVSWTIVEAGVYVIAATLPSLRPLIQYTTTRLQLKTLYSNLVDRYTHTSSANKCSDPSITNTRSGFTPTTTAVATARNNAHLGGFVEIDKQTVSSSKASQEDIELGSC